MTIYTGDPEKKENVEEHLKALDKPTWGIFEPIVRDTGVTHTAEEIEARRQERLKRGDR